MLNRLCLALAGLVICACALADSALVRILANGATAVAAQSPINCPLGSKTIQAVLTTTSGAGTATVTVEGSLTGANWDTLGTLSPTNTASDSITLLAPAYTGCRANVTAISGTGAAVTVYMGYGQ